MSEALPGSPGTPATRALLLTDVVDSTKLSEQIGDAAMAQVWAAHDRVARDLLPPWRGREIDKTDGMLLLFEHPADAVQYAQAYHAGLAAIAASLPFNLPWPLRARAGLHVGPVILRQNAPEDVARGAKPLEVDGLAKPTAARVMSLARGGQTLLTPEAREALGDALAHMALQLQSHGHWMIKGVSTPVELFEVGSDPAAFTAPPDGDKVYRVVRLGERWLPVREVPNNLPAQASSFVGREREIDELKALLGGKRLVTLLGMGGMGKTRLSLQVTAEMRAEFPDGTWFIDLSPLRDEALVPSEVAQTLGVREEPGRSLLQAVVAHLAGQRALLVFDNCEHLIKAAAVLAHAIVRGAPGVRLMASSRELLRVPGEHAYPVHPLPLPGRGDSLAALRALAAVQLFEQRAQAQKADWVLSEREAPAVAELVQRLEGIPLALELAAARVRSLPVAEINKRLNDRYKLLTGGSRVGHERQQTLRALVDWSYELLPPAEQQLFQRLGVFVGGFDLAAAEAVCADEAIDSLDVLDLLASLVDKSLVLMEERRDAGGADVHRYRLLETLRDYAAGKLALAGDDERAAAAARHCEHYFALAKQGRDGMQGPQQREWLDRLDLEQDNLRAAIALPQTEGSPVSPLVALKMAVALQNYWVMRGGAREGRAIVKAMLGHPAVIELPMAQAHALYVGSALAWVQGDLPEALDMLQQCLALRRGLNAPGEVAATLSTLAVTLLSAGELEAAHAAGAEAVALFRQCGRRIGEAISLLQLGEIQTQRGELGEARSLLRSALNIARALEHPETEGEAEMALGHVAAEGRDADAMASAAAHYARSLVICTAAGDHRGAAHARWAQGALALRQGSLAMALPALREALQAFDGFEMRAAWTACLEDLAALAMAAGDPGRAAGLNAGAARVRAALHLARSPRGEREQAALQADMRACLGQAALDAAAGAAQDWDVAELQRQALAIALPSAPPAA